MVLYNNGCGQIIRLFNIILIIGHTDMDLILMDDKTMVNESSIIICVLY